MLAIKNVFLSIKQKKEYIMSIFGIMILRKKLFLNTDDYFLFVAGKRFKINTVFKLSFVFKKYRYDLMFYTVAIDCKLFYKANIHNLISFELKFNNKIRRRKLPYNSILKRSIHWYPHGKVVSDKNKDTSFYLRRAVGGNVYLSIRKVNIIDSSLENIKVTMAYFLSVPVRWAVKRNSLPILVFEKESSKYEESASVVYEELVNKNVKNAYFILSKEGLIKYKIDDKFKGNLIVRNSFRHYLYFFLSNIFIATEAPAHSIELRIANNYVVRRLVKKDFRYVFLQHGVTYMVSLSSKTRSAFKNGSGVYPEDTKIVVSSKLEAEHFVKYGGYKLSDLYITGLPKFDRAERYASADKIIVMPTWRLWEYNQIRANVRETGYYKMVEMIISSIPEDYKNKVLLLPHPLFRDAFSDSDFNQYIDNQITYDEALKNCRLLITDYSSIAYDAFYRGADVAFWWADKDACMKEYGGELMLNEDNVFGPVAYTENELREIVINIYESNNRGFFKQNFKDIVDFDDGKNTERLIFLLERDGII